MVMVSQMRGQVAAQGTPQWVRQRIGYCTASRVNDAMDFTAKGKPGARRVQYMFDLVAERMCDIAVEHYVTREMQHGIDTEPVAAAAYAEKYGVRLLECEFMPHPEIEFFGASPDRRIANQPGLIEIKAPTTQKFLRWCAEGVVPDEHKKQMIAQMLCTGAEFVDFVAYDPRVPEKYRMFVRRFVPTEQEMNEVKFGVIGFLDDVEACFRQVTEQSE